METTRFRCVTEKNMEEKSKSNFRSMYGNIQIPEIDLRRIRVGVLTELGESIIPLWGLVGGAKQILTWEFDEDSVRDYFLNPNNSRELFSNGSKLKKYVRDLISEAVSLWGDSSPYVLQESNGITDFRVSMKARDNCNAKGCVLASAFFPSDEEKQLALYPILFRQTRDKQVGTVVHELGHTIGLRHSFAQKEVGWPNALFGDDSPFSIMNYGDDSQLTSKDREDLKKLYQEVWSGRLKELNNMSIKLCYTQHNG